MKVRKIILLILMPLILSLTGCNNQIVDNDTTDITSNTPYPISNTEPFETTIQETPEQISTDTNTTEEIPLEIISHRFDEVEVYGNKEIRLIVTFNHAFSEEDLGNPMTPIYTYKYYLSTDDGNDFIVDYGKGNSLSSVYFNKDYTEYEIANSGNGMREGKYISDPMFNEDNIKSIKIVLFKKASEDRYNDDYEITSEYIYPSN